MRRKSPRARRVDARGTARGARSASARGPEALTPVSKAPTRGVPAGERRRRVLTVRRGVYLWSSGCGYKYEFPPRAAQAHAQEGNRRVVSVKFMICRPRRDTLLSPPRRTRPGRAQPIGLPQRTTVCPAVAVTPVRSLSIRIIVFIAKHPLFSRPGRNNVCRRLQLSRAAPETERRTFMDATVIDCQPRIGQHEGRRHQALLHSICSLGEHGGIASAQSKNPTAET